MVSNEVVSKINVLCFCMELRIPSYGNSTCVVTENRSFLFIESIVSELLLYPQDLCCTTPAAIYSAYVVEVAIEFCFLLNHDINLAPRN